MKKIFAALAAATVALGLAGCVPDAPRTPPKPEPVCVKSHSETNMNDGVAAYMLTGSHTLAFLASQKSVCDAWRWPDGSLRTEGPDDPR